MSEPTKTKRKPRRTKMLAMVDLFNNNVYRVAGECYVHLGPLPREEIAVKAPEGQPLGRPVAAPLGNERGAMPPPEWTTPGFGRSQEIEDYDAT